jgi:cytochrome c553
MRFLRAVRAVLWLIFGVRRRADAARDLEGIPPRVLVATGLTVLAIVIVTIASLVRYLTSAAPQAQVQREGSKPQQAARRHGPVTVRDTMEERVAACTTCHSSATEPTRDGFSPRIAGKPAGYLFNQLASFRDGRRSYAPMVYLVQNLSDDYLREMAGYFSRLDLPYPPPERASLPEEDAARARRLVEHGDPARGIPACVECHGRTLAGVAPNIPGILGLPRQYMYSQFGNWRTGKLRSVAPDCMAEVARRLAPDEAALVAAWLSSRPVPPRARPETGPRELPLACGSVPA